ncbi:MAG: hypothetical protein ACK6BC_05930 [Cyanobacteriota bacterium]
MWGLPADAVATRLALKLEAGAGPAEGVPHLVERATLVAQRWHATDRMSLRWSPPDAEPL